MGKGLRYAIAAWVGLALLLACSGTPSGEESTPLDTASDPLQTPAEEAAPFEVTAGGETFRLTPLATYAARGIVLDRSNYSSGWNGRLSPCDVALAWGALLENDLYKELDWSQSGRWYWWQYDGSASPKVQDEKFVARYSSNTHIIPATPNLARAAKSLSAGDTAELCGHLVRVDSTGGEGNRWVSSTSRQDMGDGSCEVLYLTKLRIGDRVYE